MNWYKTAAKIMKVSWKFANESSFVCGHCYTPLSIIEVDFNPHHHFNPGQHYQCQCGKSELWANSIRYTDELKDYCDDKEVPHHLHPERWGFCNDRYCPKCWNDFAPLTSVFLKNEQRYVDIWGCRENCEDNKKVMLIGPFDGEMEGQKALAQWYKSHQDMWRNKI